MEGRRATVATSAPITGRFRHKQLLGQGGFSTPNRGRVELGQAITILRPESSLKGGSEHSARLAETNHGLGRCPCLLLVPEQRGAELRTMKESCDIEASELCRTGPGGECSSSAKTSARCRTPKHAFVLRLCESELQGSVTLHVRDPGDEWLITSVLGDEHRLVI